MEDISYFLSMGIFKDHNLNICPIPTDENGICVEHLRSKLQEVRTANSLAGSIKEKQIPLFVYIIPEFHNPTGSCLSEKRREELIEVAAEYNLMVVADEVYQMLDFTSYIPRPGDSNDPSASPIIPDVVPVSEADMMKGAIPPVPEPLSPSNQGNHLRKNTLPFRSLSAMNSPFVITISSFSKILAPGLRVGWIEFPSKDWANSYNELYTLQSSSCICHFSSSIVAVLMEESLVAPINESLVSLDVFNEMASSCPLYSHIHNLRIIYATKYEILTTSLVTQSEIFLDKIHQEPFFGSVSTKSPPNAATAIPLPKGFLIQGYGNTDRVGGYFLWLKLPEFCSAKECEASSEGRITPMKLLSISKDKYNLDFKLGNECAVDNSENGAGHGYIRMCFAK